jgi:hypothetical protein
MKAALRWWRLPPPAAMIIKSWPAHTTSLAQAAAGGYLRYDRSAPGAARGHETAGIIGPDQAWSSGTDTVSAHAPYRY